MNLIGPNLRSTDFQLVQAALAGEAYAYRTLVERHERRVYRFLLKHVVRADDAEDLAQETFLQAYRSLRTYQGVCRFTTWLTGIALNVARNHHNRSHLRAPDGCGDDIDNTAGPWGDPCESAHQAALMGSLQRAISTLVPEQRECVTLIALEGLAYEEASSVLGVPIGTVKSRLARARAKLAEALKDR